MDEVLDILSDGRPLKAIQIGEILEQRGFTVPKRLVNSVLFSEARRYVHYDHKSFLYSLREADADGLDEFQGIKMVSKETRIETNHIKARYIGSNTEYVFTSSQLTGSALFDVSTKGRLTQIVLNEEHPLYPSLGLLLENSEASHQYVNGSVDWHLKSRKAVEILLSAWARYESDQPDGPRRYKAEEARIEWGRNARAFLIDEQDDAS